MIFLDMDLLESEVDDIANPPLGCENVYTVCSGGSKPPPYDIFLILPQKRQRDNPLPRFFIDMGFAVGFPGK
jgi:hypothetical protein